jgi:hypothetical protein
MKHLKTFENTIEDEPHAGYFVILKENDANLSFYKDLNNFVTDNIGVISGFVDNDDMTVLFPYNIPKNLLYKVQYSDYSDVLKVGNTILVPIIDIKHFSQNKEDIEHYISADKYNI